MIIETFITQLQSCYKNYESEILFEDAIPIVDFVYTKEMGFLLFADDTSSARVTAHDLLKEAHKVWNKKDKVFVVLDNQPYNISSLSSRQYPDEDGYISINC